MFSCVGIAPIKETRLIDSLNQIAYYQHYKDLDLSYQAARTAYESATLYLSGKAEACNNLGFYSFMRMDFDTAERYFNEVYDLTQNELELLIADVGMMKIYQRTAMNKEFYDYRNTAIRRIRRIDEDKSLFVDKNEKIRLNYAYTEFSIVSAIYYYYLQQLPEARVSIAEIKPELELAGDTAQLLYYHYIKGSASLSDGDTPERRKLNEFDELYLTWQLSAANYYPYFEGNSLQGLANLLISSDNFELFQSRRSHALMQFGFPVDRSLPLKLAQKALGKFREYDDIYQIAGAYVSIGRYLNEHGHYAEALDTLSKALDCVNLHHQMYYSDVNNRIDILEPYVERDTVYTEVQWINSMEGNHKNVKTVPEWISRIREQLCVSYSGLGMKFQSDYNRNIYLDILKYTRQDKELESRYLVLQEESKQLNAILLFIILGLIVLFILFWVFNRRSKVRNRIHTERLQLVLDICQKVTASIPSDIAIGDDIIHAITTSILPEMQRLVGAVELSIRLYDENGVLAESAASETQCSGIVSTFNLNVPDKELPIGEFTICTSHRLSKDDLTLLNVITPYIAWAIDNGMTFISLGDERERLDKQRYIFEQHIARGKRENLIKKSCLAIVNGIIPYIDRIINEVYKLKEKGFIHNKDIKTAKYQYIEELVTKINEYNDILALWIKMKQGTLSLNIENFELNELFELVKKGRKTFEMRQQEFDVESTDVVVKADRALTLFMINTLTENARKYTQAGGTVNVYARRTDEYVEISVEDNGRGLSPEDVALIQDEKVYDSRMIGMKENNETEELKRMKGSGFGLMNCKGIIEKYRKTNPLFHVCMFSVDSKLGKGSRFYFRLPLGVRKTLGIILCLLLPLGMMSCKPSVNSSVDNKASATLDFNRHEELLEKASAFTDTAYYCNIIENYELALQYVDSAMTYLNIHYQKTARNPHVYLTLDGDETPAELIWREEMFYTDYPVIMDIRNGAAVSLLALKRWDAYSYNNKAFTALYKLTSEDQSLEAYCRELEGSTTNKIVGIILCFLLLLSYMTVSYILYVRKRLNNRWNLEQVLDINKNIFSSSLVRTEESMEALQREENTLREIPRRVIAEAFEGINELLDIESLSLAVYNEMHNRLEFASTAAIDVLPEMVQQSFDHQTYLADGNCEAFPLIVEVGEKLQCVGVLYLERPEGVQQEDNHLLLELIARYVAIVVFNAVVKLAVRYRDIESAYEDTHRASWEDSMLHVQNMVLDNCLSTIKHETIYYPNKIKLIIEKLTSKSLTLAEEKENVDAIGELIEYYKGIFTILSSCAARQLEEVTFRRTTINVSVLLEYAQKYFRKNNKEYKGKLELVTENLSGDVRVLGDVNQLYFLFENLIDEALQVKEEGILRLQTIPDGQFVRFLLTDTRREKSVEELNQLFYPSLQRMTAGEKGVLRGTEYLVCKQIIRDHDEYAGRRGCRINAEPAPEGGYIVYFTIAAGGGNMPQRGLV